MFPCSHFLFLSSLEATRTTSSPPVAERTRTTSSPSSAERTRTISSPSSAVGTRTTSSPSSPCGESFGGVREPQGGDNVPPSGGVPRGVSPLGDSLVTFSSGRKSPGCRAWQGHALAERLHIVGCRGYQPLQRTSAIGQNDRTAPPPAAGQSVPRSSR